MPSKRPFWPGIAEGQPFRDGNKRSALVCLLTFLAANGYGLGGSQQERAQWILDLADLHLSADEKVDRLARILRQAIEAGSEST